MTAHFINISTLLIFEPMVWIIDKYNPTVPLLYIQKTDFDLIKKGIYKNQNNVILHNGTELFISDDLLNKIKIQCKLNKVDITNVRFSLSEIITNDIKREFQINIDKIKHLKNTKDYIYLLCSNDFNNTNSNIQKDIIKTLNENGIGVNYTYQVNDNFIGDTNDDEYYYEIQKILLQHAIGFKLSNTEFVTEDVHQFNEIHYYDDKLYTKVIIDNINYTLSNFIKNTPDNIRTMVLENISDFNPIIYAHKTNNNQLNQLETYSIRLNYITFFRKYEEFSKYYRLRK